MITWAEHKAEQAAWRNRHLTVTLIPAVKQYGNTRPPWVRKRAPQQHPGRNRIKREDQRENARQLNLGREYAFVLEAVGC